MRLASALALVLVTVGVTSVARAAERGEAVFAGGCFWCMETAYKNQPGVKSVTSGFDGGSEKNVSYEEVSTGATGHAESVRVVYDPGKTSYAKLLDIFWHSIDPFAEEAQFCDRGHQYRSVIFYLDDAQKQAAENSKRAVEAELKHKVATLIAPATVFVPADEHHQEFYRKNPEHYRRYREGCGRDARLQQVWGDKAATPAVH
jgi:peptide-methionine (S)-S-oxide reductase